MIPVGDVIPSRTRPWVTIALIAANLLVFARVLTLPATDLASFFGAYGLVPADFRWPALATSLFVHTGWLHVVTNMACLWIFGATMEDRMGHLRFLIFYVAVGTVAALTEVWAHPALDLPLVGASGAVAGVMGAYLANFPFSRVLVLVYLVVFVEVIEVPALFFLGLWFLLQVLGGIQSAADALAIGGVALWAHAGGFVAGAALVWLFRQRERQRVAWWSP